MNKFKQKKSGFTLVETLVAISIFTVSILGMMSVLASGIANTTYAKQKIIADYLAQEGIEYARNMRDNLVLSNSSGAQAGWTDFKTQISAACEKPKTCRFDNTVFPSANFVSTCTGNLCKLYFNNGSYNTPISGVDSGFTRWLTADTSVADQIKITSVVSWAKGSGAYNTTFSETLYNWVQ